MYETTLVLGMFALDLTLLLPLTSVSWVWSSAIFLSYIIFLSDTMAIKLNRISPSLYLERETLQYRSPEWYSHEKQGSTAFCRKSAIFAFGDQKLENANGLSAKSSLMLIFFKFILFWQQSHYSVFQNKAKLMQKCSIKKTHISCGRMYRIKLKVQRYSLLYSFLYHWANGADPVILVACTWWKRQGKNK